MIKGKQGKGKKRGHWCYIIRSSRKPQSVTKWLWGNCTKCQMMKSSTEEEAVPLRLFFRAQSFSSPTWSGNVTLHFKNKNCLASKVKFIECYLSPLCLVMNIKTTCNSEL